MRLFLRQVADQDTIGPLIGVRLVLEERLLAFEPFLLPAAKLVRGLPYFLGGVRNLLEPRQAELRLNELVHVPAQLHDGFIEAILEGQRLIHKGAE